VLSTLANLVIEDKKRVISFVQEQINLLKCHTTRRRYSPDFLILSSLIHSISPHAYHFMYNCPYITLPHPSTIKRLCSHYNLNPQIEQSDENLLLYIKDKSMYLKEKDKTVVLLMDEIHIKPFLDFKSGNILGMSYNREGVATTAYVFMVQSITSTYKDVIHIAPVKKLTAEQLHHFVLQLIVGMEKIGFKIFCIASDNNAINRKAISQFATPPTLSIVYPHPVNPTRPLFFIIDCVHLLKCIRNNWINQKNDDTCLFFPDFEDSLCGDTNQSLKTASFLALRKIHENELNNLIKYCHTLSVKSLCPNNFERQNVKLALQIFN
jgi:hypothetical protein